MAVNFTPTTLTSGFASVASLNAMFTSIQTALQDAVSRSGNGPNSLTGNLDMDGRRILNLPEPVGDHEPARKIDQVAGPEGPEGPAGANGTNGTNGTNGQGVPEGGTAGQFLAKIDDGNYNTEWLTSSGGGESQPVDLMIWSLTSTSGVAPTTGNIATNSNFLTSINEIKIHRDSTLISGSSLDLEGFLNEALKPNSVVLIQNLDEKGSSDEILFGTYKISEVAYASSVYTLTCAYTGSAFSENLGGTGRIHMSVIHSGEANSLPTYPYTWFVDNLAGTAPDYGGMSVNNASMSSVTNIKLMFSPLDQQNWFEGVLELFVGVGTIVQIQPVDENGNITTDIGSGSFFAVTAISSTSDDPVYQHELTVTSSAAGADLTVNGHVRVYFHPPAPVV